MRGEAVPAEGQRTFRRSPARQGESRGCGPRVTRVRPAAAAPSHQHPLLAGRRTQPRAGPPSQEASRNCPAAAYRGLPPVALQFATLAFSLGPAWPRPLVHCHVHRGCPPLPTCNRLARSLSHRGPRGGTSPPAGGSCCETHREKRISLTSPGGGRGRAPPLPEHQPVYPSQSLSS